MGVPSFPTWGSGQNGRSSHVSNPAISQQNHWFYLRQGLARLRIRVCIVSITRLMPGVHQPDPPGLIHDDLRLLPPWRGSSFFPGKASCATSANCPGVAKAARSRRFPPFSPGRRLRRARPRPADLYRWSVFARGFSRVPGRSRFDRAPASELLNFIPTLHFIHSAGSRTCRPRAVDVMVIW